MKKFATHSRGAPFYAACNDDTAIGARPSSNPYVYATHYNQRVSLRRNWVELGFHSEDERTDRVLIRDRHERMHCP